MIETIIILKLLMRRLAFLTWRLGVVIITATAFRKVLSKIVVFKKLKLVIATLFMIMAYQQILAIGKARDLAVRK